MDRAPRNWEYIRLSMKELNPKAKDLLKDNLKAIKSYGISAEDVCEAMNIVKEISRKLLWKIKKPYVILRRTKSENLLHYHNYF